MIHRGTWIAAIACVLAPIAVCPYQAAAADEADARTLINQAEEAYRKGDGAEAIRLADRAVATDTADHRLFHYRGTLHFRLNHIDKSITDFDREIKLRPDIAPYHWQRGISLYYAGRYEDGRRQFELHQTVNSDDVENAAWHFLCAARADDVETARRGLLPIAGDTRVPMMEVYALFAGHGTVQQVLEAAKGGDVSPARTRQQLFYAHLYLGLYYEAAGDHKRAAEHITLAAVDYGATHYMGEVARIHYLRLENAKKNRADDENR